MIKAILDKAKVYKREDGMYVFDSHYISEMDEEGYQQIIGNFKKQIKKAAQVIEVHDPIKAVNKEVERLTNQHKINKEAIKNFDKYIEEEIESVKKQKEDHRKTLQQNIDNYLKIKELVLNQIKTQKENIITNLTFKMGKDKELLAIYEQLGEKNNVKEITKK